MIACYLIMSIATAVLTRQVYMTRSIIQLRSTLDVKLAGNTVNAAAPRILSYLPYLSRIHDQSTWTSRRLDLNRRVDRCPRDVICPPWFFLEPHTFRHLKYRHFYVEYILYVYTYMIVSNVSQIMDYV